MSDKDNLYTSFSFDDCIDSPSSDEILIIKKDNGEYVEGSFNYYEDDYFKQNDVEFITTVDNDEIDPYYCIGWKYKKQNELVKGE